VHFTELCPKSQLSDRHSPIWNIIMHSSLPAAARLWCRANMARMATSIFRFLKPYRSFIAAFLLLTMMSPAQQAPSGRAAAASVPAELSNREFWALSRDSSEEDGFFRSDNLLSNETSFQYVIPELLKTAKQGRVYLGVGPEQNFTYIAALKPAMAVIIDIRHGNLDVHLMYKALFELSSDRADFVSRLFSRKRPSGLTSKSTAGEIFDAYVKAESSKEMFEENLKAVEDVLMNKHQFPLRSGDQEGIRWAMANYYRFGPWINYNSSLSADVPPAIVGATGGNFGGNNGVTYATLMTADDGRGEHRSFLANEENFAFVKDLETRNLIVPVVGDFGGNKAIHAVASYLKSIDAMVSAFYLSNVEQFLVQDGKWDAFCGSVSALPLDETSYFIRSGRGRSAFGGGVQSSSTANMLQELAPCREAAH
jgi:hypothetical protein